jgi:hypothetical protein
MAKLLKNTVNYKAKATELGATVANAEYARHDAGILFASGVASGELHIDNDIESFAAAFAVGMAKRSGGKPLSGDSLNVYKSQFKSYAYPPVRERRELVDSEVQKFIAGKTKKETHDKGFYDIVLQLNSKIRKAKVEELAKLKINSGLIAETIKPRKAAAAADPKEVVPADPMDVAKAAILSAYNTVKAQKSGVTKAQREALAAVIAAFKLG